MFHAMKAWLQQRLARHDLALFRRLALSSGSSTRHRRAWRGMTHLGGATSTVTAVLVPFVAGRGAVRRGSVIAACALLVSHLIVQLVKRRAVRERPAAVHEGHSWARVPDRFSFPSGHATAAMAVAFAYSVAIPSLAIPLTLLAVLVGVSRVRLGVHYPGDVLAGQALAVVTVLSIWVLSR